MSKSCPFRIVPLVVLLELVRVQKFVPSGFRSAAKARLPDSLYLCAHLLYYGQG